MSPLLRLPRRLLAAVFCLSLSGCVDAPDPFISSQPEIIAAVEALCGSMGAAPRVLRIEIGPNEVAIDAQDPQNRGHVDRWRVARMVIGPFAFARLIGPEAVSLNLLNPDLEANLFDLNSVKFSETAKLSQAAIKRAQLQDEAIVARMEIVRQTYILPQPGSGDVRWRLRIDSGREHAEVVADVNGAIVGANLEGTLRAQNLNIFNEPNIVAQAVDEYRATIGADVPLKQVEITARHVDFVTRQKAKTFGGSGPPEFARYHWDLSGMKNALVGDMDMDAMLKRAGPPPFSINDVDWRLAGQIKAQALAKVALPGARADEIFVRFDREAAGAPVLVWEVRVIDPEGTTMVVANVKGDIRRVDLPANRRKKVVFTEPAALAAAIVRMQAELPPETPVAQLFVDNDRGFLVIDDAASGGKTVTFTLTGEGLKRSIANMGLVAKADRVPLKELAFLTEARIAELQADALKRFGGRKTLYFDRFTVGPHAFAPRLGARAVELRFRDTPENTPRSGSAWIVYDFAGRFHELSAP